MAWKLSYRQLQTLYCTTLAFSTPSSDLQENKKPHYDCKHGLTQTILYKGGNFLKELLLSNDIFDDLAKIANYTSTPRLDRTGWEELPVVIRDFSDVPFLAEVDDDILITPQKIYIPWPLPAASHAPNALKEFETVANENKIKLTQEETNEFLLYKFQIGVVLDETHPRPICFSDEDLITYVTNPKHFLKDKVEKKLGELPPPLNSWQEYLEQQPLPKLLKVSSSGDFWDSTLECFYEPDSKGNIWELTTRGLNAAPPYDHTLIVKISETDERMGLSITELISEIDKNSITLSLDEIDLTLYKDTKSIYDILYFVKPDDVETKFNILNKPLNNFPCLCPKSEDCRNPFEALDSCILCWSQCPPPENQDPEADD